MKTLFDLKLDYAEDILTIEVKDTGMGMTNSIQAFQRRVKPEVSGDIFWYRQLKDWKGT